MTFLVSGVLGTLYFCLDNDNLLFWSREKGGSSEPNELPLDPPLLYNARPLLRDLHHAHTADVHRRIRSVRLGVLVHV